MTMTRSQAEAWVVENDDGSPGDDMSQADLKDAFWAIFGRAPTEEDDNPWLMLVDAVPHERPE